MAARTEALDSAVKTHVSAHADEQRAHAKAEARYGHALWVVLVLALVAAPCLISWASLSGGEAKVFESTPFSAAYGRYFDELLNGHALWLWGQYILNAVNYAPLYGFYYAMQGLFGNASAAYHASLLVFQIASTCSLAAFLRGWQTRFAPQTRYQSPFDRTAAWIAALLFVSSLANFNYLKSNVLFALPYYSLPIQLFLTERFIRSGAHWAFGLAAIVAAVMNSANVAFFVYVEGIVVAYAVFLRWRLGGRVTEMARDLLLIGVALLPAAILLAIAVLVNLPYYGSLEEVSNIMAEGMYSMKANMINILALTTDWGLFDGFNGEAYYEFGSYYQGIGSRLLALSLILVPLVLATLPMRHRHRAFYLWWTGVALFCVFIQLGSNNPFYQWLMENVFVFQVFRNITKLTPAFVLALLAIVLYQVCTLESERIRRAAFTLFAVGCLIYNAPFWTYADYFLRDRSAKAIPEYWYAAGAWMDTHIGEGSRTLLVPATYINDVYYWDGRKSWVQGSLPDALWRTRTFRLSEGFVGAPPLQSEMRALLKRDPAFPRGVTFDYTALTDFVRRNGFDYVVLARDLASEYQHVSDVRGWLTQAGYSRVALFGQLEVFRNPAYHRALFESDADLVATRIDHLTYSLHFSHMRGTANLRFAEPFRAGWRLALGEADGCDASACASRPLPLHTLDLRLARRPQIAEGAHFRFPGDLNGWRIDTTQVLSLAEGADVIREPDGSVSFTLLLHFEPQLYFVAAFWAFVLASSSAMLLFFVVPQLRRVNLERTFH